MGISSAHISGAPRSRHAPGEGRVKTAAGPADDARVEIPPAVETVPSPSARRWPPSADPQGIELSIGGIVLAVLGITLFGYISIWAAPEDQGPTAYTRWLFVATVAELIFWLCVVGFVGWWRASGLVTGSFSLWGVLPLGAFAVATFLSAGRAEQVSLGPGLQLLIIVGVVLAALGEEVAFRGFLLHGLTRRVGGTAAVLAGSFLFAVYHVPYMLRHDVGSQGMVALLLWHFGFGVFMCRVRAQTGSVWFPTGIHALWNLSAVGVAVWAFPDGQAPFAFGLMKLVLVAAGILVAGGLGIRAAMAHAARGLVSGRPSADRWPALDARVTDSRPVLDRLTEPTQAQVFERFTVAARRVIVLAQEEAVSLHDGAIDTEHLLLGLIHENDGAAAKALETSGITLGSQGRLAELVEGRTMPVRHLPFSPRTKLILKLAITEADAWGHAQIGTEHLLLATTAVRAGGAARVLRAAGVDRARLRRTLIELLSEAPGTASNHDLAPADPVAGRAGHEPGPSEVATPRLQSQAPPPPRIV